MSRNDGKGGLLTAFKRGDIEQVLKLSGDIPDSAKVNIPHIVVQYKVFNGNATPLTLAIQSGNYHLCRLLVEDGHSLNGESEKYFRLHPLSLALHFKHSDIAELLIEFGANVNLLNKDKNTYPLFWVIHTKLPPHMIDVIIAAGFPVNALVMKKERMTAIQCAVLENNLEAIKTLIKYPLDFNHSNASRETALGIAIRSNFVEIVKLLVDKGASLNSRNSALCPLFLAIRFEHIKMVELLLDLGANLQEGWVEEEIVPPLQFAINYLNVDIVMLLIARGANVNDRNCRSGETALHVTASYIGLKYQGETLKAVQLKIAKALIGRGADVNVKDIIGRTPLDGAICGENTELCKLLLREGAEVHGDGWINVTGSGNRFEYICCVKAFQCAELISMCLDRGGDYNFRDHHGLSPYHCAMAKHNPDMVTAFWRHGCPYDLPELKPGKMKEMLWYNPDPRDKKLLSVQADFMDGIKNNRLDSVVNAIQMGAEPKGSSVKIPSTLHYVAASGSHSIAKTLLEHGLAVNKINVIGQTPLYVAVEKKNLQMCKVLLQNGACFDYRCKKLPKNRTVKILVKESDQLSQLFSLIYKCFKLAKKGDFKVLKVLNKLKKSDEQEMLQVLMNCENQRGFTLLNVTLALGHVALAGELMQFRLNNKAHKP
ncbi:ankyrin-1-like [Macrosteles quadrilineatus]|uniref:ankyrin-1-like n=1 Tax=Macrosteles quadrilineatus TaxID=74068 RepID=UPI0023E23A9C|nr:ankyrin-1-like [Macrosteles quadrilineatus]